MARLKLIDHTEEYDVSVMPYEFNAEYSWRQHLPLIEKDIDITRR